jgi:hypothetical protein
MLKKALIMAAFFLSLQGQLKAQIDYEPGYVVKLNLDILKGYVCYIPDYDLTTKGVLFKKDIKSKSVEKIEAREIREIVFDNGRKFIRIDPSSSSAALITLNKRNDSVLAKLLITGKIDLYLARGKSRSEFLLINNSNKRFAHIIPPKSVDSTAENGKKYSITDKNYLRYINLIKEMDPIDLDKSIRYNDRSITMNILEYNRNYEADYPISQYKEQRDRNYEICFGIPVLNNQEGTDFRVSLYRNTTFIERDLDFSFKMGITYRYWRQAEDSIDTSRDGNPNFLWQAISLVPGAIQYQTKPARVSAYLYLGAAFVFILSTDHRITNGEFIGNITHVFPLLSINPGAGLKIKTGKNALLAEITPSIAGTFLNLGFMF